MSTPHPAALARYALWIAGGLFAIFAANALLTAARSAFGLPVAPFMPRVPEFLVLLLSALAFAVATLLHERARPPEDHHK